MTDKRTSTVGLVRGNTRYENVWQALEQIADQLEVSRARHILIKPNLVSASRQLASTHVDGVRAVLDFLRTHGGGHVMLAEATSADGSTWDAYRNLSYLALCDEYDVELVDLAQGEWIDATLCSKELRPMPAKVARRIVESDFRISIAPPKSHNDVIVTLTYKNMALGALKDRAAFHQGPPAMHLSLYALAPLVAPHLSILEGFEGMEGGGPLDGDPVPLRVAVAGTDWVAVDTVGTSLMGYDPQQVGYLVYADRGGLGAGSLDRIDVRGNTSVRASARTFAQAPNIAYQLEWHSPLATAMVPPNSQGAIRWGVES